MSDNNLKTQKAIQDFVKQELGVRLPDDVASFLTTHQECISDNPFDRTHWKSGFGDVHFICGTTKAFREQILDFPENLIVIGYIGEKEIVVNHQKTAIDVYIATDVRDTSVFFVDSLGKIDKMSDTFKSWIEQFVCCLEDDEQGPYHHHGLIERLRDRLRKLKDSDK